MYNIVKRCDMEKTINFNKLLSNFNVQGEFIEGYRYGEGHINDTYLIKMREKEREIKYILQRINTRLFQDVDKLMSNIVLVTDFCKRSVIRRGGDPLRECLNVVLTRDNKSYYRDGDACYRIYIFIEGATTYQIVRNPQDFYESAVAFGNFANLLADFDASQLFEILPNFHNTKVRYANFLHALEENVCNRREQVQKEIDWVMAHQNLCGKIIDKIDSGEIPLRVSHNDTKLNNVMIDDKTGKGIAVIDLDTVMPGSLCYDFGDSIRFGCNPAAEDEPDLTKVNFRVDLFETYLKGYLSAIGNTITQAERENLPMGAILMTYECGMRFLTDYLEGDVYFRTHRPGQNLDRAHTQFKLVEDMLSVYDRLLELASGEICQK